MRATPRGGRLAGRGTLRRSAVILRAPNKVVLISILLPPRSPVPSPDGQLWFPDHGRRPKDVKVSPQTYIGLAARRRGARQVPALPFLKAANM